MAAKERQWATMFEVAVHKTHFEYNGYENVSFRERDFMGVSAQNS
jgi:hypothetical protein